MGSFRAACRCGGRLVGFLPYLRDARGQVIYRRDGQAALGDSYVYKHLTGRCEDPHPVSIYHLPVDPVALVFSSRVFKLSRFQFSDAGGFRGLPAACGAFDRYGGIPKADTEGKACLNCLEILAAEAA
jgi:hypothetical protein